MTTLLGVVMLVVIGDGLLVMVAVVVGVVLLVLEVLVASGSVARWADVQGLQQGKARA
jgi:hypothetical protein